MLIVPESAVAGLVTMQDAIAAVDAAYRFMDQGRATRYPVVRELVGHADAVFGIKSGFMAQGTVLGLKAGGYWPGNARQGRTNHQSAVALFDAESGQLAAVISGNRLGALRTAAGTAVSVSCLARPDADTLGIVGAGTQAEHQIRAVASVRRLERVLVWNRTRDRADALCRRLAGELRIERATLERVARESAIVVTVTSAREPLVRRDWIRPGTHIAAVGTDTAGKIELEPGLVAASRIFVDHVVQARTIGECQHAFASGLVSDEDTRNTIGAALNGRVGARRSAEEITLFDSTGIALQDLAVAALVLGRARDRGVGTEVAL